LWSLVEDFLTEDKITTQNHQSALKFKYGTSTSPERFFYLFFIEYRGAHRGQAPSEGGNRKSDSARNGMEHKKKKKKQYK